MFREMRRKGQQLCEADCAAVLDRGTSGMLALEGGDGYPYTVLVNYLHRCLYDWKGSRPTG